MTMKLFQRSNWKLQISSWTNWELMPTGHTFQQSMEKQANPKACIIGPGESVIVESIALDPLEDFHRCVYMGSIFANFPFLQQTSNSPNAAMSGPLFSRSNILRKSWATVEKGRQRGHILLAEISSICGNYQERLIAKWP